jgi:hypothetical protein
MNIRATGRSALIIAAGLWICASGPLHATENDTQAADPAVAVGSAADTSAEPAKATRHHGSRKTASKSRKSDRHAAKDSKTPADEDTAKAEDAKTDATEGAVPPAVANANAQWPSETTTNMSNMATQAGGVLSQMGGQPEQAATASPDADAGTAQVVAADQLNDLDRAATDGKPPLTLAKATIDDAPAATEVTSSNNSPWDQTSMIGKIFIAFGGLLTMASAVRMFIA